MIELTKKLCLLHGVTGNEEEVREHIRAYAEKSAAELKEDSIGNLMILKKGKK